jgi:hypothetical protein
MREGVLGGRFLAFRRTRPGGLLGVGTIGVNLCDTGHGEPLQNLPFVISDLLPTAGSIAYMVQTPLASVNKYFNTMPLFCCFLNPYPAKTNESPAKNVAPPRGEGVPPLRREAILALRAGAATPSA